MAKDYLERIAIDPKVMVGKPVIRGTRIPVELVVRMVGQGISDAEILADYPRLTLEDIRAALTFKTKSPSSNEDGPIGPRCHPGSCQTSADISVQSQHCC